MSEQYPQYQPQHYPPPNPGVPSKPPSKRHWVRWTLIGVVAVAIAAGVGTAASGGKKHTTTKPAHTTTATPAAATTTPPTIQPPIIEPAGPVYVTLSKTNVTVTLKILTKDCFGDAGCNVTYRPVLTQLVPAGSFDPTVTYDVTYQVRGGSDGAQVDTLYVTGDKYESPSDGIAQTGSSGVNLTAVVTAVEAQ